MNREGKYGLDTSSYKDLNRYARWSVKKEFLERQLIDIDVDVTDMDEHDMCVWHEIAENLEDKLKDLELKMMGWNKAMEYNKKK